ncbi:MAG: aldehyde dehydrogenase family protein, partial [Aquabacterium sp.]
MREADPQAIRNAFEAQLPTALAWRESTAKERIARIKRLRDVVLQHRQAIYDAFMQDYRKSSAEVDMVEFLPLLAEARDAIGHLKRWMKPTGVWPTMLTMGTSSRIEYQPRGRVLIIAPWNYPLQLCFGPLVSALAAGTSGPKHSC